MLLEPRSNQSQPQEVKSEVDVEQLLTVVDRCVAVLEKLQEERE